MLYRWDHSEPLTGSLGHVATTEPSLAPAEAQSWADALIKECEAGEKFTCGTCQNKLSLTYFVTGYGRFCSQSCADRFGWMQAKPKFGPGTRLSSPEGEEVVVIGDKNYFFAVNIPQHNVVRFSEGRGDFGYVTKISDLQSALTAAGYRVKDD